MKCKCGSDMERWKLVGADGREKEYWKCKNPRCGKTERIKPIHEGPGEFK
jgi:hypothetical protein